MAPESLPLSESPRTSRASLAPNAALALGIALLAAAAGWSNLSAGWIAGDEYLFLVHNPDVTGAGVDKPLTDRLVSVFLHAHGDLYQPIPIATYALEWQLWGADRIRGIRRTDVLLHALNAVLLWLAIERLLRRLSPPERLAAEASLRTPLAASVAVLWALHPALAPAYAADMGRTHLLSAGFALGSLLFHLRALDRKRGADFGAALLLLLAAMLCKPLAGWFLVAFSLEAATSGILPALRSKRVWLTTLLCAVFAVLTLKTSREAGILEDVEIALFGDPLTRSLLGAWLYIAHLLWPLHLATWYPPDIHTGWSSPKVWLGSGVVLASIVGLAWSARGSRPRAVAVGIVWFWAGLLPVIGLIGARVAAAQDRYLYVPAMGAALALAAIAYARLAETRTTRPRSAPARWHMLLASIPALLGLALLPVARADAEDARVTLRRAERSADLDPADPRRLEFVAIAYRFNQSHAPALPPGQQPPDYTTLSLATLRAAVEAAENAPHYFRDDADRAAFHRRISFRLTEYGAYDDSLRQALRAADFEPDQPRTLTRLAHAYRHLQRWEDARLIYERLTHNMPTDPQEACLRWTEYGDLLLYVYERADLAEEKYQRAHQTGKSSLRTEQGLARVDVLVRDGTQGFVWAMNRLEQQPDDLDAARIVALYHLRHEQWPAAHDAYAYVLERDPRDYESLRGFQHACLCCDRWNDTLLAWRQASSHDPANLVFRSFAVLAAAGTSDESARAQADQLLADDPQNQFAAFAIGLDELRHGNVQSAVNWARRAGSVPELPRSNGLTRALEWLETAAERENLPPEQLLLRAGLLAGAGRGGDAIAAVSEYETRAPESPWKALAESLTDFTEPPASNP